MSYEKEKEIAIAATLSAWKLCERVRENIPQAMEKIDKSPVTVADYGSQAIICKALAEAFPNDPVVGEEDATELQTPE
ncbi:MAG: 3'(2'),5'-bisphosphate nucleotidase, partial [Planktothrix sp.]